VELRPARDLDAAARRGSTLQHAVEPHLPVWPEQTEVDRHARVRLKRSATDDDDGLDRGARRGQGRRLGETEVCADRLLDGAVRRIEPGDLVAAVEVRVRVVLGEDLADRPVPADLIAVPDAAERDELGHSSRLPPERGAVRLVEAAVSAARVDVVAILVDHGVRDVRAAARGNDHEAAVAVPARVAAGRCRGALRPQLVPVHDPDRHPLDLVAVRRAAEQAGVPAHVGVGTHVEVDRPPVGVPQHHVLRGCRPCRDERPEKTDQGDEDAAHGALLR
jgi:hypothetical protein